MKDEDSNFNDKTDDKLDEMSDFMKGPAGAVIVIIFGIGLVVGLILSFF